MEPDLSNKEKDEYGLIKRAQDVLKTYKEIRIVRFEAIWPDDDPARPPSRKRIAVQPGTRTFVHSTRHTAPRELQPGAYSVANLFIGVNTPGKETSAKVGICATIDDLPFTATLVFPDYLMLGQDTDATRAMQSLSLRASNKVAGAVRLQLSIKCTDPIKLLRTYAVPHLERKPVEVEAVLVSAAPPPPTNFGEWIKAKGASLAAFFGRGPELQSQFFFQPQALTFEDLYPRFHLELATIIRASIYNETVEALYNDVEVRKRIEADIKKDLSATLKTFGMEVFGVSAFQFLSPKYEEVLTERADVALGGERLNNRRDGEKNRDGHRELDEGAQKKDESSRGERELHTNRIDAVVKAEAGVHLLAEQDRERERSGRKQDFKRTQKELDHRQDTKLIEERAKMALGLAGQLQNMQMQALLAQQDAEQRRQLEREDAEQRRQLEREDALHRRRLQAVEQMSKLPPEERFLMAMTHNPELKTAFIASQQANAQNDKMQLAQRFQQQITSIYGQNSDQTNALLMEAAKQLGLVAAKRAEAERPQIVATGTIITTPPRE